MPTQVSKNIGASFLKGSEIIITLISLADGAGRVSDQIDLGPYPILGMTLTWNAEFQHVATPTLGDVDEMYIAWADDLDGSAIDGDVGLVDAALSNADQVRNMMPIGNVIVDAAAADDVFKGSGEFPIMQKFLTVVVKNEGGSAFTADESEQIIRLALKFPQAA